MLDNVVACMLALNWTELYYSHFYGIMTLDTLQSILGNKNQSRCAYKQIEKITY